MEWVIIPVIVIVMWGLRGIASARAGGGELRGPRGLRAMREEIQALRADVDRLREGGADAALEARLLELEERVDFAERLLARNEPRTPRAGG